MGDNITRGEIAATVSWWVFVARHYLRELWDGLPGPWPVRVLLIVACAAVPGPVDEIVLVAVVAACRARRARGAR